MTVLHLTEEHVSQLVDAQDAFDAVQTAFLRLAEGRADNVPRRRAKGAGIVLHTLSASAEYLQLVGWKAYTTTASGARFHVGLYEQQTGRLVALIEADQLGRLRTAAASAVAAAHLTTAEADAVGLFGTGGQAETQLQALARLRPLRRACVYGRDPERRRAFCERMERDLKIEVRPVETPREAVEDLPIVVTATTSRSPVFEGAWLADNAFVAAMGANALNRAEIDAESVKRASLIVCDSVEACRIEAGDLHAAEQAGAFAWSEAHDLAQVVAHGPPAKRKPSGPTIFKSVGLAIEDVALAAVVLERAKAQRIGLELPI
ncbi:MAG TPA: ornithine cyclodeaminase family protein [Pirellulales bacterium]